MIELCTLRPISLTHTDLFFIATNIVLEEKAQRISASTHRIQPIRLIILVE